MPFIYCQGFIISKSTESILWNEVEVRVHYNMQICSQFDLQLVHNNQGNDIAREDLGLTLRQFLPFPKPGTHFL